MAKSKSSRLGTKVLRGIIENAGVMLAYFDAQFNFVAVNSAYAQGSGYSVEELVGKNHFALFPDEENQAIFEQVRATGKAAEYKDKPFKFPSHPERGIAYWDWKLAPLKDNTGHVQGLVLSLLETTQRKKAEEALRHSEEQMRLLVEGTTDYAILMLDPDGHVVSWNKGAERIKGYQASEIIGKHFSIFYTREDVQSGIPNLALEKAKSEGRYEDEGWRVRKDGSLFLASVTITPMYDERKKLRGFSKLTRDITEARKRDEEVARLASFPTLNLNPVVEVDFEGNVHYSNPAAESMFPGMKEAGLNHPFLFDWKHVVEAFQNEGKNVFGREAKIGDKWFYQYFYFVQKTQRVRIYSIDTDELKRAESELTETRNYLDNLLDYANAPIIVWDPEFKITRFNHAFERLTGFSSDDVIGRRLDILFPKEKKEEAMLHIQRTLAGEYWESVEIPILHKDGTVKTVLWNSANIHHTDNSKVIATIAQGQDITERKKTEDRLRETSDYLNKLLNYANAPIIVWDSESKITMFNHAFERLTGLSSQDAIGKPLDVLFPKDRRDEALNHIQRTLAGEHWETVEIPILHTDGTVKTALWNSANIYDATGKTIIATIAQGQDITERKKTEEKLAEQAFMLANANDAIIAYDPDYRVTFWNKSAEKLYGYTREEALGKLSYALLQPTYVDISLEDIARRLTSAGHIEAESVRITKDGRKLNVDVHVILLRSEKVEPIGYVSIDRDITQRKLVEDALRDSQIDLNRAQAVAKIGSWRLDVQQNKLLWSDETYQIFGIPKATSMTYETFLGTVCPDDREYVDQKWQAALRGEPYDIEHRIIVNGEAKWVREKAELEFNSDGSLLGGFGTVQDITERKQAENELRETRDYLDNLLNYANAPIIVWDQQFKITRFNHAFERLAGYKTEEVAGKDLSMLFPAETREESLTEIQHTLAGEYWESVEIPILRKDGNVRTVLWNSANIYAQDGRTLMATIAQGQDITERKRLEEQLRGAERMVAIGETAAMVGHDLRNPLQAIVGFVSVAQEQLRNVNCPTAEKEILKEPLMAIADQSHYMNKIVSDLQDYAEPLKPEPHETDLPKLANEVVLSMQIPETVEVSVAIPTDFPKILVDSLLMKRVFTNLFRNAVEAMPDGGKLTIDASQAEGMVLINVRDTGIGIAKENLPKMFKPLFTTKSKGQGFGLPVCKRIIEALGGSIIFESQVGKGSTFTVKIPSAKDTKNERT